MRIGVDFKEIKEMNFDDIKYVMTIKVVAE